MERIKIIVIGVLLCMASYTMAQEGQNTPYSDDRVVHFGFSLGVDFSGYGVQESGDTINVNGTQTLVHARNKNIGAGFAVGFITDVRLCRYLNLRFCPSFHISERSLSWLSEDKNALFINPKSKTSESSLGHYDYLNDVVMPMDIPLYLKFSAAREGNYRPYVIAGGGVSMNMYSFSKERLIATQFLDYFVEVGFGVDSYFRWFKFCPEIKYHIGFNNQLGNTNDLSHTEKYYMESIHRLTNHIISLTFNFE